MTTRGTDGSLIGIEGIKIEIFDQNNQRVGNPQYTDENGTYKINGLQTGTYTIKATEPSDSGVMLVIDEQNIQIQ